MEDIDVGRDGDESVSQSLHDGRLSTTINTNQTVSSSVVKNESRLLQKLMRKWILSRKNGDDRTGTLTSSRPWKRTERFSTRISRVLALLPLEASAEAAAEVMVMLARRSWTLGSSVLYRIVWENKRKMKSMMRKLLLIENDEKRADSPNRKYKYWRAARFLVRQVRSSPFQSSFRLRFSFLPFYAELTSMIELKRWQPVVTVSLESAHLLMEAVEMCLECRVPAETRILTFLQNRNVL